MKGLVAFVVLSIVSGASWAADLFQPRFFLIGPGETLELVWFLAGTFRTGEDTELDDPCESVEFDITFSEPTGLVTPVTQRMVLSADEPLAEASATYPGFGKFVLVHKGPSTKQGACVVLSTGRVANEDGTTIANFGNFQIHPPNSGHPYTP